MGGRWGAADRKVGKVQPPFAQGGRAGHRWLAQLVYSL